MQTLLTNALNDWLTLWERAPARESLAASALAKLHSVAGAASHKDS